MSLNIPSSAKEVVSRSKADVQRELSQSNPFLKNSWLGAIVTSAANRIFDFYIQLRVAIRENFPDTATEDRLVRWAAIWGLELIGASKSNGNVVATGDIGSVIVSGTIMTVSGVGDFSSTAPTTISSQTINIDDLTRVGSTVTALTPSEHRLANGVGVVIAGAANSEYNISALIIVTGLQTFQYEVIGTPPNEIGTSATATSITASIPISSDDFGDAVNLVAGTQLTLQSPIVGVDDVLVVDFGAIGGGTNQETEESLRDRMLDRIQNPTAHFNVSAIVSKASEIAGVTRVFVQEVTPDAGQVTVFFMRDGDANPIPTGSEITKVKDNILTIKPANTTDNDVIVLAPTGVVVDFTFSSITPDTATMQSAIKSNLEQFFAERSLIGVNIDEDAYRSAIFNTVDPITGGVIQTFTLSLPVGDVVIIAGEIGTLGNIVNP